MARGADAGRHGERGVRLFVAIHPPLSAARDLAAGLARLDLPEARATPLEQIHLTLHFIGETALERVDRVAESTIRAASGLRAFDVVIPSVATMPFHANRPRLIAAIAEPHPTLMELKRRLARRLSRSMREDPADRFTPHLTLARFASGVRFGPLHESVSPVRFRADRVTLVRSVLKPTGAEHSPVADAMLPS